jgi:hypothetical protein
MRVGGGLITGQKSEQYMQTNLPNALHWFESCGATSGGVMYKEILLSAKEVYNILILRTEFFYHVTQCAIYSEKKTYRTRL